MTVVFNITTFDVGGKDAVKSDNKLTGEEIMLARKAGWDIDVNKGYTIDMGTPKYIEDDDKSFFKFTDRDGFSITETALTALRCIFFPLLLVTSCEPHEEATYEVNVDNSDLNDKIKDANNTK